MGSTNVADLTLNGRDAMGAVIVMIYGRKPPEYAVYRTEDRVLIHFADAEQKACEQRKAMSRLNPLRGEINGLVDGWRRSTYHVRRRCKAERYDRRVGDALVVGFEDDVGGAELLLEDVKQDILDERIALARFQYLIAAFLVGLASMLLMAIVTKVRAFSPGALDLFRAAATGAVGAFFSIALAIRGRTVLPDLQWVSNLMDAALRMVIGVIGGAVLMALITARVVNLSVGHTGLAQTSANHWLFVLLVGFIAGFSERFVPDLLAKAMASPDGKPAAPSAEQVRRTTDQQQTVPATSDAAAARAKADQSDPLPEEGAVDACASDVVLPDELVTSDAELPAASGGVAKAEAA